MLGGWLAKLPDAGPPHWGDVSGRAELAEEGSQETLIFVDVDGVLNVGVRVKGEAPINLTDTNIQKALQLEGQNNGHAERILEAARHELGHGEGSTYASLLSRTPSDVSEVLIGRLAGLIIAAGEGCTVVLSSSWRKPQHARRAQRLEQRLSAHLGFHFAFHESTPLRSESGAEDRLESIGLYLAARGRLRRPPAEHLRILVLEDFCICPLRRLLCRLPAPLAAAEAAFPVDSAADAERFLRACAQGTAHDVRAKVVHTYDGWLSPGGLRVEVGSGLTLKHHCAAMAFLGSCCERCTARRLEGGAEQEVLQDAAMPLKLGNDIFLVREEQQCGRQVRGEDAGRGRDAQRFGRFQGEPAVCVPGQA